MLRRILPCIRPHPLAADPAPAHEKHITSVLLDADWRVDAQTSRPIRLIGDAHKLGGW
jgi:hypothetical protein